MQVAFDTATIEIRVKKSEDDLDNLTENDIKASIDLKDKDEVTAGVEVSRISTADTNS